MATLRELYLQLGVRGFRALASEWAEVHENLDAPKVRFRSLDGELALYRRGTRLNVIDRVLDPQLSLPFSIDASRVPSGPLYEVAYLVTPSPLLCEYAGSRAGSMVLVSKREDGKLPVSDLSISADAAAMGLVGPPVLLGGRRLHEEQVDFLLGEARRSLQKPTDPWHIMEALGLRPHLGTQWGSRMGGLTLVLGYDRPVRVRIPDPVTESARAAELQSREHLDMHGIILCDFIDFFENELKLHEVASTEGKTLEERLLTTVSNIYMGYVRSRAGLFDDVKISDKDFAVDESLVRGDVRSTFSSENNQKIFQMLLQSLYSPKKKPTGTLTESILVTLRRIRQQINSKISEGYEPTVPTFDEYLMMTKK